MVAGHCLDFGDSALPYLPFSEVLGRLEAELPEVVAAGRRGAPRPGPAPARAPGAGAPGRLGRRPAARARASTAPTCSPPCTPCSRRPRQASPVLLVIEDCHWADQSTRDLLSFLFSRPFDGAGGDRGVVPLRRPAPSPPAAPPGRRVVAAARRRADAARPAGRRAGPAADRQPVAGRHRARRSSPRSCAGPRATRSSSRSWSVPPSEPGQLGARRPRRRAAGAPRPARRRRPPGGAGGERRRPQGRPRPAGRRVRARRRRARGGAAPGRRDEPAGPRRRHLLLPARAARRGGLRRPAARRAGAAARAVRRGAARGPGPRAPLPSWPGTPGWPTTSTPPSTPASAPATRRWRWPAPTRRRSHYEQALELLADPARRAAADVDISKLAVSAAEALTSSGQPTRAAALLAEQLGAAARRRAAGLAGPDAGGPGRRHLLTESPEESPLDLAQQAVDLLPEDAGGLRAKVLAIAGAGAVGLRPVRRGAGRRPGRAGARRAARPARAGRPT